MLQIPSNPVDTLRNSLYKNTSTSISFRREITNCIFKKTIVWQGFKAKQDFLSCRHMSFSCFQRCGVLVGWLREVGGRFLQQTLTTLRWFVTRRWWWFVHGLLVSTAYRLKRCMVSKRKGWPPSNPTCFEGKFRGLVTCLHFMLFTQNSEIMMGW